MYVRLAFAVAAHLESEILIVDEVLAVGDAEFQKKCLGKMGDVRKSEGRTVLFVSHNMTAIQKLCNKVMLMHQGSINSVGETNHIIHSYLQNSALNQSIYDIAIPENVHDLPGYAYKIQIEDECGNNVNEIPVGKFWQVRVFFRIAKKTRHFIIALGLTTSMDVDLRTSWSNETDLDEGYYEAVFKEESLLLSAGIYRLNLGLSTHEKSFHYIEDVASITISQIADKSLERSIIRTTGAGLILNPLRIEIKPTKNPNTTGVIQT
jgi:lipopolysaccharide transport system ATP-binding protein